MIGFWLQAFTVEKRHERGRFFLRWRCKIRCARLARYSANHPTARRIAPSCKNNEPAANAGGPQPLAVQRLETLSTGFPPQRNCTQTQNNTRSCPISRSLCCFLWSGYRHPVEIWPNVHCTRRFFSRKELVMAANKSHCSTAGNGGCGIWREHGKGVRELDTPIHLVSQQASSIGNGQSRSQPVLDSPSCRRERCGVHFGWQPVFGNCIQLFQVIHGNPALR